MDRHTSLGSSRDISLRQRSLLFWGVLGLAGLRGGGSGLQALAVVYREEVMWLFRLLVSLLVVFIYNSSGSGKLWIKAGMLMDFTLRGGRVAEGLAW